METAGDRIAPSGNAAFHPGQKELEDSKEHEIVQSKAACSSALETLQKQSPESLLERKT